MEHANPGLGLQPHPNRRALIRNHLPLLNDPEVVAFLDNPGVVLDDHRSLEKKLVRANEPALLLELLRTARCDNLSLDASIDEDDALPPLPEGLFEYFAEHINLAPSVTTLDVTEATLTAAACSRLQASLNAPGCRLIALAFANCRFADAQVRFPTQAPTVQQLHWSDDHEVQPAAALDQCLPSLATWRRLAHASLLTLGAPLNFANIAQLLLANPTIDSLYLMSDVAPVAPGRPGYLAQHEPSQLFDLIRSDRTVLKRLTFRVTDTHDPLFNDRCLRCMADSLVSNTTLEMLEVPGITMCTLGAQRRFTNALTRNHALIELAPLDAFGDQAPVRRNQRQRFWFSTDFILGAAQALMQAMGAPRDTATLVASHLAPTAVERVYCGATMALLCKATHTGAIQLRSAVLREALKSHIKAGDRERCSDLVQSLMAFHVSLLPHDHRAVVKCATAHGRLAFLPSGYAG